MAAFSSEREAAEKAVEVAPDDIAGAVKIKRWAQVELQKSQWLEKVVKGAANEGFFEPSERLREPRRGAGGAGSRIVLGEHLPAALFYLFAGRQQELGFKEIVRCRRAGVRWIFLGLSKEERFNRHQLMRPVLEILRSPEVLPADLYTRLWTPPEDRGEGIPSELLQLIEESDGDWDLLYRKQRFNEFFPLGMVLDPPQRESAYLAGVESDAQYQKQAGIFKGYVERLFDGGAVLPDDARQFVIEGYSLADNGGVFEPRPMSLLEQVWTHLECLRSSDTLEMNLHRCLNSRCRQPFFFPWRRNHDVCGSSCRSAIGHWPELRRKPSE